MMRKHWITGLVLAVVLIAISAAAKERSEIDAKYKWDLNALYPSIEAFQQAKNGFLPLKDRL